MLNYHAKIPCLFFDQINNYANFRRISHLGEPPSTDLSTVIVDKQAANGRYKIALVGSLKCAYHARPRFWH
jgi:hypothetical protein